MFPEIFSQRRDFIGRELIGSRFSDTPEHAKGGARSTRAHFLLSGVELALMSPHAMAKARAVFSSWLYLFHETRV